MVSPILLLVAAACLARAGTIEHGATHTARDHHHQARVALPASEWYHAEDAPINNLFRRQSGPATDGATYAQVGSPTWSAAWPVSTPDANAMPQAWKDALNAAVQAGKIPNIPPSSGAPDANPTYPAGHDPNTNPVCSATYKCRLPGDIWDGPDGTVGISFDDGPLPTSDRLYTFLQQNHVKATHFFIGVNIVNNWKEFNTAFSINQDDIAVHTWTHPHMTELKNEDVVAQLAWTMQIIHNSTGGRVPKFWRPPYGDSDARVSAIAKEVLGLTTIIWNQDTDDWSLGEASGTTPAAINTNMHKWLTGPKTPGLIMLEHELSDGSVQAFIDNFPLIAQNGWKPISVVNVDGLSTPYQNGVGTTGAVSAASILANIGSALISPPPVNSSALASGSSAPSTVSQSPASGSPPSSSSSSSSAAPSSSGSTNNQVRPPQNGASALALPSTFIALLFTGVAALMA